jgi:prevent-host-death family protein
MDEAISVAQAKRHFFKLLQAVRSGRSYAVTSQGKAVAKIVPVRPHDEIMRGARRALIARLRSQPIVDIGPWTRDELYER